ncbi:MAG: hypothetical protein JWO53_1210 [Chlamydiia bacterium]|nr:hypothetical protein [Chlamydiia bacterium]
MFKIFLLLAVLPVMLFAQENMNIGISYFQSKRADLAVPFFKSRLEEKDLSEEERQVTLYNLGAALLLEGSLSEAYQVLHEVNLEEISSPLVRQSVLYNQAFSALQLAERAHLLSGSNNKQQAREYLIEVKKLLPLLDEVPRKAIQEEMLAIELSLLQKESISSPEEILAFLYQEEQSLLCYTIKSKPIEIYSQAIRENIFRRTGIQLPQVAGLDLAATIDRFRTRLEIANAKSSHDEIERLLEICTEAEVCSELVEQDTFWKQRNVENRAYLKEILNQRIKAPRAQDSTAILKKFLKRCEGLRSADCLLYYRLLKKSPSELIEDLYMQNKPSPLYFEVAKDILTGNARVYLDVAEKQWRDPRALLDLYLEVNFINCLQFQINQLKKNLRTASFSDELHLLSSSWKKIEQKTEQSGLRVYASQVDTALLQISTTPDLLIRQLRLAEIEYWLLYSQKQSKESLEKIVRFGVFFERLAFQQKNKKIEGSIQEVSLNLLSQLEKAPECKQYFQQIQAAMRVVESIGVSPTVYQIGHAQVAELLEKILQDLQKNEKIPKEIPATASNVGQSGRLSPVEAMEHIQQMQDDDTGKKRESGRATRTAGVPYPW